MDNKKRAVSIGDHRGMLEVIDYVGSEKRGSGSNSLWLCRCVCGKEITVPSYRLRSGLNASCGCMSKNKKESFVTYIQESTKAARELYYPEEVINDIRAAKNEGEIERIMVKARHGGYKA